LSPKPEVCPRVEDIWNVTHGSDTEKLPYPEVACIMANGIEFREKSLAAGFKPEE
jgi:hypothetical protein